MSKLGVMRYYSLISKLVPSLSHHILLLFVAASCHSAHHENEMYTVCTIVYYHITSHLKFKFYSDNFGKARPKTIISPG